MAFAAGQHGVVASRQVQELLGLSPRVLELAVRHGMLHRLHRGVYAVGRADVRLEGRCLAAVLAFGPGALLSHHSAAWLWGLGFPSPVPLHVTSPLSRRHRGQLIRHRARNLGAEDAAEREGIPLTSVARTLLDLASAVRFERLSRLLQRAEEQDLFDLSTVESVIERNRGHRGARPLRRAIAIYRPVSFQRSDFERRFLAAAVDAGLPQPHACYFEHGYELDLYWPEHRFAVELDVFETHGTRESFEADRLRQEDLLLAGIEMIRVTGPRFEREPGRIMARLSRLLAERGG